jgi:hypothetical protein
MNAVVVGTRSRRAGIKPSGKGTARHGDCAYYWNRSRVPFQSPHSFRAPT